MATHGPPIEPPPLPDPRAGRSQLLEYEEFIEAQLRKTRSHVRSVDISVAVMVLLAFTLGYFLLAGLVDHWLITGGLGFWGRLLLWVVYVGASAYWIVTQIVPLLVKRINPLYAAETIERSRPTLKNTLLNFLLFRANPSGVHQKVLHAIEEQAATNLAGVPVESAVDRTRLIRLGYVLVGILVVCAAYMVLSPKDLLRTVRRVAMPWADISAPTRTTIDEIAPGDAKAFRGQQVEVKAHVDGLPEGGKVMLYYTTADRQIVDRSVEMSRRGDDYLHSATLPAGDAALEQTLSYRIAAGDAVTRPYTIEVVAAPTIVVQAIEYEYPSYTGLLAQRVEHQGDIKAIEGTRVTLEALANQDIDAAHVDFECDNTLDLRMRVAEQTASGTFALELRDDRQTPVHNSYQVTFKNTAGQRNPQPVRHRIAVSRDIAPEIQFVSPRQDEIELPADAAVDLEIVASDPDFALARVTLAAAKEQETIVDEALLEETWRGQLVKKYRLSARKLGLAAGDVVDYWAVAVDNKDPRPNQTETSRRRIRIVSPSRREGQQDQLARNEQRDEQGRQPSDDASGGDDAHPRKSDPPPDDAADPADDPAPRPNDRNRGGGDGGNENTGQGNDPAQDQAQDPAGGDGQRKAGDGQSSASDDAQPPSQPDSQPSVPNDGTNDGEAIERILDHQRQQDREASEPRDRDEQKPDDQARDQENRSQQGKQDSPDPGEGQRRQTQEKPEQQDQDQGDKRPDDAGRQQGSGANQGGEGEQSAQKQPGGKPQQPGQDRQRQGEQNPSARDNGQPDKANRGKPGDTSASDQGEQSGTPSQEKPQRGNNTGQKQPAGTKDSQSSGEEGQGDSPKQPDSDSQASERSDGQRQRGEGSDPQNAQRQGDGQPNAPDENRQTSGDTNTREDGTPQDPSTKGQGAQSNDDPLRNPDKKPPQSDAQRPEARGGDAENSKGDSGGGQKTQDNQGSPSPSESRPTEKSANPSPDDKEEKPEGEAQSGNTSERESETESEQDGEQSGGGRRGGGQKANQPGTGGAGQNTAADEGSGRSDDAGDGETSDRAGGDRQADGKTGQSGTKTGPGSRTKPSDGESEKSGGQSDPQDTSDSPSGRNAPGKGAEGGENPSDSRPHASNRQKREWQPTPDKADKANLEYAREATDLALEHLKDQLARGEPDQDLLDQLGWTRSDLEKFVSRWEAMRDRAQAPGDKGEAGRRELDETLKSLGLRPRSTTLGSNAAGDDRAQGYKEAPRTTPPAEYIESFKAYTQGTARGGK